MSRALLVIRSDTDRQRAAKWARKAPDGTRIEFKASKRSIPQNARMWAMLSDVARQKEHCGHRYTADQWKCLFMHACGSQVTFLPSLDGSTFVPLGYRSSDLSKEEASELIEFILHWGAENGVRFSDPTTPPDDILLAG